MTSNNFSISDVVGINPRTDEPGDWSLSRRKGEIIKIDPDRGDHSIQVSLGRTLTSSRRIVKGKGWFAPGELELVEGGWTLEDLTYFTFGHSCWHSLSSLTFPWSTDNPCMHSAHDGTEPPRATKRALVNIWGTVCEFDVCADHIDFHGRLTEVLPCGERWRKKSAS